MSIAVLSPKAVPAPFEGSWGGEGAPPAPPPVLVLVDRSIRRERRLEALLRRAARGKFREETRESLRFEAHEDREHARILRRHRIDLVRSLGVRSPAPGARVAKVGPTVTPESALREALRLRHEACLDYRAMAAAIEERFFRRFLEVLSRAQEEGMERLRALASGVGIYSTVIRSDLDRPQAPSSVGTVALAAGAV